MSTAHLASLLIALFVQGALMFWGLGVFLRWTDAFIRRDASQYYAQQGGGEAAEYGSELLAVGGFGRNAHVQRNTSAEWRFGVSTPAITIRVEAECTFWALLLAQFLYNELGELSAATSRPNSKDELLLE